ncbi:MAG TPA: OmpA family protein [Longimicrobiales bacterium]|nr:OmpA family protein [Longimicrobiales bacterium]
MTARKIDHPRLRTLLAGVVGLALSTSSCASLSNTEKGALGGAGAGAVVGGIIGDKLGSTTKGAIIGAAVGGATGAAIGRRMDNQAQELQKQLPNAHVERVGEGIAVTFDSGILFDVDSDVLRAASRENLADLARSLRQYDGTEILVVGHTDATGTDSYNQSLSQRRAASARAFLMTQGVAPDRVEALGRGESEPIASNDTAEGRQENRRVEVAIFAGEEMRKRMLGSGGAS